MERGLSPRQRYDITYRAAQRQKRRWVKWGVQDVVYERGEVFGHIGPVPVRWHIEWISTSTGGVAEGRDCLEIGGERFVMPGQYRGAMALFKSLLHEHGANSLKRDPLPEEMDHKDRPADSGSYLSQKLAGVQAPIAPD